MHIAVSILKQANHPRRTTARLRPAPRAKSNGWRMFLQLPLRMHNRPRSHIVLVAKNADSVADKSELSAAGLVTMLQCAIGACAGNRATSRGCRSKQKAGDIAWPQLRTFWAALSCALLYQNAAKLKSYWGRRADHCTSGSATNSRRAEEGVFAQ